MFEQKTVIAMIHVDPLPGSPRWRGSFSAVLRKAVEEALIYRECAVECIAIENMHDVPYLNRGAGPEVTAAMAVIGREVKSASGIPCGIQILAGSNREALAAALAGDLDFIRAEGFVFAHVADEGLMDGCAGDLLRYRRHIGADHIAILTDIKKKHSSHAITSDTDIVETARAAEFFLSDGVIVTGKSTGSPADLAEIVAVKRAVGLPVIVGSGVTEGNVAKYLAAADAVIVGSSLKENGMWDNPVDRRKVESFMAAARNLRNQ
jgi:membrane complex biogenesis BtpA family protein